MEKSAVAIKGFTTPDCIVKREGVVIELEFNSEWPFKGVLEPAGSDRGGLLAVSQPHFSWSSFLINPMRQPASFMILSTMSRISSCASRLTKHSAAMVRQRMDMVATPLWNVSYWKDMKS